MKLTRRGLISGPALIGAAAATGLVVPRAGATGARRDVSSVSEHGLLLKDRFFAETVTSIQRHRGETGESWRAHTGFAGNAAYVDGKSGLRNDARGTALYVSSSRTPPIGYIATKYALESVRNDNVSVAIFVPDAFTRGGYRIRADASASRVLLDRDNAGTTDNLATWHHAFEPGEHELIVSWKQDSGNLALTVIVDGDVVGAYTERERTPPPGLIGLGLNDSAVIRELRAFGAEYPLQPVYIDPTYVGQESGSYIRPYSSWAAAMPVQSNRTYLIKSGTTLREEVTIKDANGVTLDIYDGTNMAIVDGEDERDRCVVFGSCDDLIIRNIHATRGTRQGFLMENGAIRDYGPILVEDCRADYITRYFQAVGDGVGFQLKNMNNVDVTKLTVRRVTCDHNGHAGFDQQRWGGSAEYYDIVARYNGGSFIKGGGFYTHPWRLTGTGPWTNIGGQLWEWDLPSIRDKPGYVGDSYDDNYGRPLARTDSPTPGPGEFFHDAVAHKLIINLHDPVGDPNVRGVQIARTTINVLVDGAETAYNGSPIGDIDATGFQFDDMSHNVVARNIYSHHNLGTGIVCHQTLDALVENSVAEYNAQDQFRNHMWYGNFSLTGAGTATFRNIVARGDGQSTVRAVTVGRDCVLSICGLTSDGNSETFYVRSRGVLNLLTAAISSNDTIVFDVDASSTVLGSDCVDIS